jgi:hypothetical protein
MPYSRETRMFDSACNSNEEGSDKKSDYGPKRTCTVQALQRQTNTMSTS